MSEKLTVKVAENRARRLEKLLRGELEMSLPANSSLGLAETKDLVQAFSARANQAADVQRLLWEQNDLTNMWSAVEEVAQRCGDLRVLFFSSYNRSLSAVLVPVLDLIRRLRWRWELDGYYVGICTPDLASGLLLEYEEFDEERYSTYAWGRFLLAEPW